MSKFTFTEITFPAPGSNLHNIAQQGVVALFKFWDEKTRSMKRWPQDWASSYWFLKYVQDYFEVDRMKLEYVIHEATPEGVRAIAEILEKAAGIYYFIFDEDGKVFVVDFIDSDRVTVATTDDQPEIFCQDYEREKWTRDFLDDLAQQQEGVLTDQKHRISTITIIH